MLFVIKFIGLSVNSLSTCFSWLYFAIPVIYSCSLFLCNWEHIRANCFRDSYHTKIFNYIPLPGSIQKLGTTSSMNVAMSPSGSLTLDLALGTYGTVPYWCRPIKNISFLSHSHQLISHLRSIRYLICTFLPSPTYPPTYFSVTHSHFFFSSWIAFIKFSISTNYFLPTVSALSSSTLLIFSLIYFVPQFFSSSSFLFPLSSFPPPPPLFFPLSSFPPLILLPSSLPLCSSPHLCHQVVDILEAVWLKYMDLSPVARPHLHFMQWQKFKKPEVRTCTFYAVVRAIS